MHCVATALVDGSHVAAVVEICRSTPGLRRARCPPAGTAPIAERSGGCVSTTAATVAPAQPILHSFLADAAGDVRPGLLSVQEALSASPGHALFNWLQRPSAGLLLTQLAATHGPVSHQTIDKLTPPDGARWLRHVLVAQNVLPARNERLHALERWLDAKLSEVSDPDERRLLRSYVTWSHLRRLRASGAPTTPSQNATIRNEVSTVIKMLDWLRAQGVSVGTCTQADIDLWCLRGDRMPRRARRFVAWCAQRGHMPKVSIPAPSVSQDRHLLDGDQRWNLAKILLHDDTIAAIDRVAGCSSCSTAKCLAG